MFSCCVCLRRRNRAARVAAAGSIATDVKHACAQGSPRSLSAILPERCSPVKRFSPLSCDDSRAVASPTRSSPPFDAPHVEGRLGRALSDKVQAERVLELAAAVELEDALAVAMLS